MDQSDVGASKIRVVGPKGVFSKVTLVEPATSGYIIFALQIDHKPLFNLYLTQSQRKTQAIAQMREMAHGLQGEKNVLDAKVFKALFVPPSGKSSFFKSHPNIAVSTYDLVMLVEFESKKAAKTFHESSQWSQMIGEVSFNARSYLTYRQRT